MSTRMGDHAGNHHYRGEIEIPAAAWSMVPGTDVALLRLSQFSANATDDIQEAAKAAKAAGADAMILDIRNNPGGLLEQAINVSSQFLKSGNVLQEEDAHGNRRNSKCAAAVPPPIFRWWC
ncbi:MAG: S41 family peptidase [Caldilineaceae bacterium]